MAKTTHDIDESPELRQTQTTLNDLIEKETGEKPAPNTIPIPVAAITRTRTKPGYTRKLISITDEAWGIIEAHIENYDLDESRFLTRLLSNAAGELK